MPRHISTDIRQWDLLVEVVLQKRPVPLVELALATIPCQAVVGEVLSESTPRRVRRNLELGYQHKGSLYSHEGSGSQLRCHDTTSRFGLWTMAGDACCGEFCLCVVACDPPAKKGSANGSTHPKVSIRL